MFPMPCRTSEVPSECLHLCHDPLKCWPTFAALVVTSNALLQHALYRFRGRRIGGRNTTLMFSTCRGTFLCVEQLSIRSRTFFLSSFIWCFTHKIHSWRTSTIIQAFALLQYLQCKLYTFLKHRDLLYFLIMNGSNLLMSIEFVQNRTVILSF
jgi:hypothetical protein